MNIFRKLFPLHAADDTDAALGAKGERVAAWHLQDAGYRIIERNWRSPLGELDIIGQDGDTLVFVEVKSARRRSAMPPELRVNPRKQRKLLSLAKHYVKLKHLDCPVRFDIISVWWEDTTPQLRHIQNAFSQR